MGEYRSVRSPIDDILDMACFSKKKDEPLFFPTVISSGNVLSTVITSVNLFSTVITSGNLFPTVISGWNVVLAFITSGNVFREL